MARRTRSRSTRSYGGARRSSRSYGTSSRRSYSSRGRSTARRSTRTTSRSGGTLRIVIEQPGASSLARPDLIGKMPIAGLTRNRSRF